MTTEYFDKIRNIQFFNATRLEALALAFVFLICWAMTIYFWNFKSEEISIQSSLFKKFVSSSLFFLAIISLIMSSKSDYFERNSMMITNQFSNSVTAIAKTSNKEFIHAKLAIANRNLDIRDDLSIVKDENEIPFMKHYGETIVSFDRNSNKLIANNQTGAMMLKVLNYVQEHYDKKDISSITNFDIHDNEVALTIKTKNGNVRIINFKSNNNVFYRNNAAVNKIIIVNG